METIAGYTNTKIIKNRHTHPKTPGAQPMAGATHPKKRQTGVCL